MQLDCYVGMLPMLFCLADGRARSPGAPCYDQEYTQSVKAPKTPVRHSEEGTTRWSGKVKHRLGDSTVELFFLSAMVPTDVAEQMPTTLFVTELAPVRPSTACKASPDHTL